jgi:hypothetical protein
MISSARFAGLGLALTLAVAAGACDDGGVTVPPTTGTLEITTATSGTEPDANGYSVQMDGGTPQTIGAAATVTMAELEPGNHTVQLLDIAANCTVAEENPRSVSIAAGEVTRVSFTVTCSATTGSLTVSAATGGPSPDPDGYTVTLDGVDRGALAVNASMTIDALPSGSHVVGLSGLAANCQVQGENPRTVTTTAGGSTAADFTITCAAPPTTVGTLRVITTTSGPGTDGDGYSFTVDGGGGQPIGVSATATLANTAAGAHSVRLTGLATNCQVQGGNPRSVTVPAGGSADASFAITCGATSGTIRVNVTASGSPADANGFVAKLDGSDPGKPVTAGGNVSFDGVSGGSHTVELGDVASNCSVADGASRTVPVTVGATAEVNFAVTCTATTGSIKVTTTTGGESQDDAYTVKVDNGTAQPIDNNGEQTFTNVAAGDHTVELGDIAGNCTVDGGKSKSVRVSGGAESPVTFTVTCTQVVSSEWTTLPLPAGFVGKKLWASSPTDIFVAGEFSENDGALMHYDGHAWTQQLRETTVAAVWGSSPTDVFAIGGARFWRYNGTSWEEGTTGLAQPNYFAIWGTSPLDVFAAGSDDATTRGDGLLAHYNGVTWSHQGNSGFHEGFFFDISGTSPADVYAVGMDPPASDTPSELYVNQWGIAHYDGVSWSKSFMTSNIPPSDPGNYSLSGVWSVAPNNVFAVGSAGHILHFNGSEWSQMTSSTTQDLEDVWGNAGTNVYTVGNAGIMHFDGTNWSVINSTGGRAVWGAGNDVFVVRYDGGAVLHRAP